MTLFANVNAFSVQLLYLIEHYSCWDTIYTKRCSRKTILNGLSKKIVNVHNDIINVHNDLIMSLWTFTIFLDKSFRIGFSTSVRPIFCLFLKFGQAILVRVLMLKFETFCINRPLVNEHKNAICAKKSFIERRL